jgi:hypothetical protein
VHNIAN